jgi:hypothetical protein
MPRGQPAAGTSAAFRASADHDLVGLPGGDDQRLEDADLAYRRGEAGQVAEVVAEVVGVGREAGRVEPGSYEGADAGATRKALRRPGTGGAGSTMFSRTPLTRLTTCM